MGLAQNQARRRMEEVRRAKHGHIELQPSHTRKEAEIHCRERMHLQQMALGKAVFMQRKMKLGAVSISPHKS